MTISAMSEQAFKAWFKNSKVVDKEGNPLPVYHGTNQGGFTKFRRLGSGDGIYFTDNADVASSYANQKKTPLPSTESDTEEGVFQTFLSMQNPLVVYAKGSRWTSVPYDNSFYRSDYIAIDARAKGYDGVIMHDVVDCMSTSSCPPSTVYIVFKPSQIKSVQNVGTWSEHDDDITASSSVLDAYINNEVNALYKYLNMSDDTKAEELAFADQSLFFDWYEDRTGETIDESIRDDTYEFIQGLDSATKKAYYEYADTWFMQNAPTDAPTFCHFDNAKLLKNQWLMHFSNDADRIASEGFIYGWPDMESLGLTALFSKKTRQKGPGYSFAFTPAKGYESLTKKYGEQVVMFRASGVEAYHYGDDEHQVIFWGPDARDLVSLSEGDDGWQVHDPRGNVVYKSRSEKEGLYDCIKWVMNNYDQYRKKLLPKKQPKVEAAILSPIQWEREGQFAGEHQNSRYGFAADSMLSSLLQLIRTTDVIPTLDEAKAYAKGYAEKGRLNGDQYKQDLKKVERFLSTVPASTLSATPYQDLYAKGFQAFVEKYKKVKDKDLYVQFTNHATDPLDRNPFQNPEHHDPAGVYGYPLEYVLKHPADIWYGSKAKHLRVLRAKGTGLNLQYVDDSDARNLLYRMGLPTSDLDKAKKLFKKRVGTSTPKAFFLAVQVDLAKTTDSKNPVLRSGPEQSKLFLKTGYDQLEDTAKNNKKAVINDREPEQIIFLTRNAFEVVESIPLGGRQDEKGVGTKYDAEANNRRLAAKIASALGDKLVDNDKERPRWVFYTKKGFTIEIKHSLHESYYENKKLGEKKHREVKKSTVDQVRVSVITDHGNLFATASSDTEDEIAERLASQYNAKDVDPSFVPMSNAKADQQRKQLASEQAQKRLDKRKEEALQRYKTEKPMLDRIAAANQFIIDLAWDPAELMEWIETFANTMFRLHKRSPTEYGIPPGGIDRPIEELRSYVKQEIYDEPYEGAAGDLLEKVFIPAWNKAFEAQKWSAFKHPSSMVEDLSELYDDKVVSASTNTPKSFTVVFPFPSRYETGQHLADGVLKGVYGISDNSLGIMDSMMSPYPDEDNPDRRTAILVMDGPSVASLNQLQKVDYADAELMFKDGMAVAYRVLGSTDPDAKRTLLSAFMGYSDMLQSLNAYLMDITDFNYNLNSSEEFARELLEHMAKVDFFSGQPAVIRAYDENPERTITVVAKKLRLGALKFAQGYASEGEWLVVNKELVIPPNSKLYLTKNNLRQEAEVAKYNLQDKYRLYYMDGTKWGSFWKTRADKVTKERHARMYPIDKAIKELDAFLKKYQ